MLGRASHRLKVQAANQLGEQLRCEALCGEGHAAALKVCDSEQSEGGQNEQQGDNEQEGQQDPAMADAQEKNAEALEAATQEQMAKFDEALEEQQALEQWLRRVPDDPGGLLRRKFRYQTMQRLREGEEPDESIRW